MLVLHPAVNGHAQFAHLQQALFRNAAHGGVVLDRIEFLLQLAVVVLHPAGPTERLRQVERLNRDAAGFEQLLAVTNCVESRGAGADRADARVPELAHNVAGRHETPQIGPEARIVRANRVQPGERIRDAVLPQIIADGHFAAKAVAPVADRHLAGVVIEGMNQDRHVQPGPPQGVGHGAFVAEVR